MAGFQFGPMDVADYITQQGDIGRQSYANKLLGQAYTAAPDQRPSALAKLAGVDGRLAMDAGRVFQQDDASAQERMASELRNRAAILRSLPPEQRAVGWQRMAGDVAKMTNMPELASMPYDAATFDPVLDQLAGVTAQQREGKVVGNNLVDPVTGKVIYTGPEVPQKWETVRVPYGSSEVMMERNAVTGEWREPNYGAGPSAAPTGGSAPAPESYADVQSAMDQVAQQFGFTKKSGTRTQAEQDALFNSGASPTRNSLHTDGLAGDYSIRGKSQAEIDAAIAGWKARGFNASVHTQGTAPHLHVSAPRGGASGGRGGPRLGVSSPDAGADETFGQPQAVTDPATGRVVMVQFGNRGAVRPVTDYEPAPTDRDNKPPTEGQLAAAGYLNRMQEAEALMDQDVAGGYTPGGLWDSLTAGQGMGNYLATPEAQNYRQAQEDWVRAKLRKESGAVIGDEEMAREIKTYFPQPGDGPEVIARKKQSRAQAIEQLRTMGGRAVPNLPPPQQSYAGGSVDDLVNKWSR